MRQLQGKNKITIMSTNCFPLKHDKQEFSKMRSESVSMEPLSSYILGTVL